MEVVRARPAIVPRPLSPASTRHLAVHDRPMACPRRRRGCSAFRRGVVDDLQFGTIRLRFGTEREQERLRRRGRRIGLRGSSRRIAVRPRRRPLEHGLASLLVTRTGDQSSRGPPFRPPPLPPPPPLAPPPPPPPPPQHPPARQPVASTRPTDAPGRSVGDQQDRRDARSRFTATTLGVNAVGSRSAKRRSTSSFNGPS